VLGRGGYGKVFLSKKKDTGEILALKRMKKSFLNNRNMIDAAQTERSVLLGSFRSKSPWIV
jgi:cell cycle protein kinase DBF2